MRGSTPRPALAWALPALLACAATSGLSAQPPAEPFAERLEVRETSVAAVPPGAAALPALDALTVAVDSLPQQVTRVERVREGERGPWRFVVYLDPRLAGPRSRFLAALALGQRAEELAALGTVEVLAAGRERPVLERTGEWQRIEAALFDHALGARLRLERGEPALARPDWPLLHERLELLVATLAGRGEGGPRALLVPSDGVDSAPESGPLDEIARTLAGAGWITLAMPWSEQPAEGSTARLSEFERWKEAAEGRDVAAGERRYVIDFGRVFRRLRGAPPPAAAPARLETDPHLAALQRLATPTSGALVTGDAELRAALADLARRWQVWFQLRDPGAGGPRPLEVRLDGEPLAAPRWIGTPRPSSAPPAG